MHGVQRELTCPVPQLRIKIARTRLLLQGSEGVIKAQVPKTEPLHSQRRTEPFSTDGKHMPGKRALAGARETAQADDRARGSCRHYYTAFTFTHTARCVEYGHHVLFTKPRLPFKILLMTN